MFKRYMINIFTVILVFIVICSLSIVRVNVVVSGSMEPVIHTGSVAVTTRSVDDIEIGDIVLYELDDIKVIHRVVKINEDGTYVTKGDHNDCEDFRDVSSEQIIGKYLFTIPYAGYLIVFIQNNLLLIAGIVVLIEIIRKLLEENKEKIKL